MSNAHKTAATFSKEAIAKLGPVAPLLSKSISAIIKGEPLCVDEETPVREALSLLAREKKGCVIITKNGVLTGIFTERDCVLKVVSSYCEGDAERSVKEFMTPDPITVSPDSSIAYALNLMSHGGFRHLPVTDQGVIIGLVSVKDLVDTLVSSIVNVL